jgi:hypothetical protein
MKMYEFDVVTEEISLDQTVENLLGIDGVISVQVLESANGANGWPTIKLTASPSKKFYQSLEEIFPDYEDGEIK